MDFGTLIRNYRIKAGMTQKTLASLLDCTAAAVAQWENSARLPSVTFRLKLADVLGIPYQGIIQELSKGPGNPVLITDPTLLLLVSIYSRMSPQRREAMLLAFLAVSEDAEVPAPAPELPTPA